MGKIFRIKNGHIFKFESLKIAIYDPSYCVQLHCIQSPLPWFLRLCVCIFTCSHKLFLFKKVIGKVFNNFKYLLNTNLHVKQWPFFRVLKIMSERTYELNQHRYRKTAQSIRGIGWTNSRFMPNLRHQFRKDFLRKSPFTFLSKLIRTTCSGLVIKLFTVFFSSFLATLNTLYSIFTENRVIYMLPVQRILKLTKNKLLC